MNTLIATSDLSVTYASVVAALHQTSFSKPWDEEAFRTILSSPGVFGCLIAVDTDPVGFALCRAVLDEAELLTICVHPKCRGQGLAHSLMSAILAKCSELQIKTMYLEVSVENQSARKLYESCAFEAVSLRKGYYLEDAEKGSRRIDALVMSRSFI